MTSVRFVLVLLAAALAGTAVVGAQESRPQGHGAPHVDARAGLGLDAAIALAIAQEPSLRGARADIAVAQGQRQQAALRPNPMLSLEHRDEPGGTDALTTVTVEWPLDLFRRAVRVETADRSVAVAEFGADERARVLAAEVRMQYGAAAAAIRDARVAEELVTNAERQLDLVRAGIEAGRTPPLDGDLLEVEVRRLDAARLVARGRAEAALVQLKPLLGMAPTDPLQLRDSLEALIRSAADAPPAAGSPEPEMRPDVQEAAARVSLADARLDQARREGRIDVSVYGTYMRMDNGFSQQGIGPAGALERVRGRFHYLAAGATVSLPVRNRNQGLVAAAQAERLGAAARRDAVELAARAELAAAAARDAQAQRALHVYGEGVRDRARRNLEVVRQTYELGRITVFDVLAEQKRWLEIEQGFTATAHEAWEARVAWLRARGETR